MRVKSDVDAFLRQLRPAKKFSVQLSQNRYKDSVTAFLSRDGDVLRIDFVLAESRYVTATLSGRYSMCIPLPASVAAKLRSTIAIRGVRRVANALNIIGEKTNAKKTK